MNEESQNNNREEIPKTGEKLTVGRRDILKALATVPVLGVFFYKLGKKQALEGYRKKEVLAELGLDKKGPAVLPKTTFKKSGELIRVGIMGCGGRGEAVMRAAGFAHPEWTDQKQQDAKKNHKDTSLVDYLRQENLNIAITGVCDVFDIRAERGIDASKNPVRPGGGKNGETGALRFSTYQEMLDSGDVDAVIIATPEHLHARMILDSVAAGKHIYAEKPFTKTLEEAIEVADTVKKSRIVFQLGHQNRQVESHIRAREMVQKNILGKVTLVETTTNRNSPTGAWVMSIHKDANPETIDWLQFLGNAPRRPFNLERFFRWRCWFDYSNGIASDLLSHEYDSVNQILELGIPKSAISSGGIYFYKDGREAPDVFQVVFEYPDRGLTLMYSATLANERDRGMVFMGNDASMEVGGGITVMPDIGSTRYQKKIEAGVIDVSMPLVAYLPGAQGFDAVTTATEKYFASKGLMYTYRDGRRVDSTHLHVKEWLDCIRNGGTPSCPIDRGFEEGVTCQMAAASYLQGRKVEWDQANRKIV
ncbi:MAG: Gfo/Idh/MocA family oxidoreductase [Candidatus Latescibacterota bacterium]